MGMHITNYNQYYIVSYYTKRLQYVYEVKVYDRLRFWYVELKYVAC